MNGSLNIGSVIRWSLFSSGAYLAFFSGSASRKALGNALMLAAAMMNPKPIQTTANSTITYGDVIDVFNEDGTPNTSVLIPL
jgi:hypothetical protein